jgi:hypothetical protein
MPLQPAESAAIRHAVPFDDVTQDHGVDVTREEIEPVLGVGLLRFGEAADREILLQRGVHRRALRARQLLPREIGFGAGIAQRLPEGERMYEHFHRATAQRRGDLRAQDFGGGAGDDD